MADWIEAIAHAGMTLDALIEPEWPSGHERVWGGWGPERGALVPGTAIFTTTAGGQLSVGQSVPSLRLAIKSRCRCALIAIAQHHERTESDQQ